MRFKDNVLNKLINVDTVINRIQVQLNRNVSKEDISASIENLKEQLEEVRSIVNMEPNDFE